MQTKPANLLSARSHTALLGRRAGRRPAHADCARMPGRIQRKVTCKPGQQPVDRLPMPLPTNNPSRTVTVSCACLVDSRAVDVVIIAKLDRLTRSVKDL